MEVLAASKIDADGFQLTSKAALDFGSLLVPLRYLLGWRISTLDSFTRGWEDMYFNKWMAQHTTAASQLVTRIDSLHSPRDLPLHMTQAGAATLLRQKGNVLDIADAICSRSNRPLGFVNHHCVHLLLQGLCRAANFMHSTHCMQWPFSAIHFSNVLFAARDSASSSQDDWTRSLRLSTYEAPTVVLASAAGNLCMAESK